MSGDACMYVVQPAQPTLGTAQPTLGTAQHWPPRIRLLALIGGGVREVRQGSYVYHIQYMCRMRGMPIMAGIMPAQKGRPGCHYPCWRLVKCLYWMR